MTQLGLKARSPDPQTGVPYWGWGLRLELVIHLGPYLSIPRVGRKSQGGVKRWLAASCFRPWRLGPGSMPSTRTRTSVLSPSGAALSLFLHPLSLSLADLGQTQLASMSTDPGFILGHTLRVLTQDMDVLVCGR